MKWCLIVINDHTMMRRCIPSKIPGDDALLYNAAATNLLSIFSIYAVLFLLSKWYCFCRLGFWPWWLCWCFQFREYSKVSFPSHLGTLVLNEVWITFNSIELLASFKFSFNWGKFQNRSSYHLIVGYLFISFNNMTW